MSIEVTEEDVREVEALVGGLIYTASFESIIAAAWRVMAKKQRPRPWHQRSIELAELHGPYADFAAWQDWLSSQLKQSTHGIVCSVEEMDLESGSDIVFLYSAFCVAADQ